MSNYKISTNVPSTDPSTTVNVPATYVDAAQYVVDSQKGREVLLTNLQTPLGVPMTVLRKQRLKTNAYAGTRIPAVQQLPYKGSVEVHISLHETWSFEPQEPEGTTCCCDSPTLLGPARASLTLEVPNHPLVTEDLVKGLVQDLLGQLYNVNGKSTFVALMKGSTSL